MRALESEKVNGNLGRGGKMGSITSAIADKEKEEERKWQKAAEKRRIECWCDYAHGCPVRYGVRCNLNGDMCGMDKCLVEHWRNYQ